MGGNITDGQEQSHEQDQEQDVSSFMQSIKYLIALYPLIMSLGIGGSISYVLMYIWNLIYSKIMSMYSCSVNIRYNDESFYWVRKYM